ncbi:hypothetical protein LJC00_03560 [Dysgonomonas sp. OttesenSCG-928-M03]|nr:hypothetical protein [Dysgonomonas sp. OttesenSCG-928-M03]
MKARNASCDITNVTSEAHSCCSSENSQNKDVAPCTSKHEGKCCEAERLSIDIDNRISKLDLANSFLSSFVHCYCCCYCHTDNIADSFSAIDDGEFIPIPPRDYLSLIRVLII